MGAKPRAMPSPIAERDLASVRATVRVSSAGDGMLYIDLPAPFSDAVPGRARIAVRGRIGGASFDGAAVPLGGRRRILIGKALARAANLFDGARVSIELQEIDEPALAY